MERTKVQEPTEDQMQHIKRLSKYFGSQVDLPETKQEANQRIIELEQDLKDWVAVHPEEVDNSPLR